MDDSAKTQPLQAQEELRPHMLEALQTSEPASQEQSDNEQALAVSIDEEELANVTGGGGIIKATNTLINAFHNTGDTYLTAPWGGTPSAPMKPERLIGNYENGRTTLIYGGQGGQQRVVDVQSNPFTKPQLPGPGSAFRSPQQR